MNVSVVIPVFNERETIPFLFHRLKPVCRQHAYDEIVCIDDGSTDDSLELLRQEQADCPGLKIVKLRVHSGKSAALAAGFAEARGDIIVTLDADLQNPPEAIPALVDKIGEADAVIGWRRARKDSVSKRWASRLANAVRHFFLQDRSHDSACALNAFRREYLLNIPMFKGMHRFFPALVQMQGAKVTEMQVPHESRLRGKSKYGPFSRGSGALADLLAVIWLKKRRLPPRLVEKVF